MTQEQSSLSTRLAELNGKILELEIERTQLLRQELANAEARSAEIAAFIGIYSASSTLSGSAALPKKTAKQSSPTKNKPASNKKTAPITKAKATPGGASKADRNADRLEKVIAIVNKAGAVGISANQLSEQSGIPYSAVSKIVKTSGQFRQEGEKRASRIFLK